MDANVIINGHRVQHDPSGVGHAWRTIPANDLPASIAEEIACWIIEDEPEDGAEIIASNGLHYRVPPHA
jgi:hypothetical protein